MDCSFPRNAFEIVVKVSRRNTMLIEREMLVVEIGIWIVEIREVLAVLLVRRFMLVGLLVPVVNAVVEEPVRNYSLFLALHDLAAGRKKPSLPILIGVCLCW